MSTTGAVVTPRTRLMPLVGLPVVAGLMCVGLIAPAASHAQSATGSSTSTPSTSAAPPSSSATTEATTTTSEPTAVNTTPPRGVRLERVQWKSANRVSLWVQSPAMDEAIQVQLLLPASWNAEPSRTYPSLLLLDGLRARDDASGWTLETRISQFLDAKEAVIVLPVGGQSSFYTDWENSANGHSYQWETFLTEELPPLLARDWRVDDRTGVAGLSMGGTAAMMLAERHPDIYRFAASFSGFLDLTSFGMPEAITIAMQDAGGYKAEDMWGPATSERWREQDPTLNVEKLKNTSLYVSAGSGNTGPWDQPSGLPDIPENFPGYGLELLSRMTSQTFVNTAREEGVAVTANFRPSGTHSWPYWQFEMTQAWPQYAAAMGVPSGNQPCQTRGEIAKFATAHPELGPCLTDEYDVDGGRAMDFRFGRVMWSADTGAHSVIGAIGAAYQAEGGPDGPLGLPISDEITTPDGKGRFSRFENGAIYWSPATGAHAVRGAIGKLWAERNYERGELGYPTTDEVANPNKAGSAQAFQGGTVFWSEEQGAHLVEGAILKAYADAGYENSDLGYPVTDEIALTDDGAFSRFEGGAIYWSPRTGAYVVPEGPIFEAWGTEDYERGKLGYPSGELKVTPQGQEMPFERGTITVRNGKATISE